MNHTCACSVDGLLPETLHAFETLNSGSLFMVQDLLPPAKWRTLAPAPTRGNLGSAFFREMKKRPDVYVFGKTKDRQTIYMKTDPFP